ncbi:hypothetical protein [Methylocella sp.]|uniref:hypothetical protein n=1 Tax=Methylocella sp. TaxID=1978226 RepID=UPI003782EE46
MTDADEREVDAAADPMTDAGEAAKREKSRALALAQASSLKKAAAAAEEWRSAARALRAARPRAGAGRLPQRVGAYFSGSGLRRLRRERGAMVAFALLFALPALAGVLYFSVFASSVYLSESRFAVRGGERVASDAVSLLTGLGSFTQVQDSLIVADYVKSQAIVEALEKEVDLRALYSRPGIDSFSRFDPSLPIEKFAKYWRSHVQTSIESPSGIVTLRVYAYSPQDTLKIADAAVSLSERLVNGLSTRALNDAVTLAETELSRAEDRLSAARLALRDLRNAQATLDPRRAAEGVDKLVSELRLEKIHIEQDIKAAARGRVGANAPQVQIMRARADVIGEQIASLEAQVTSQTASQPDALSAKITRFDELELERQIAEKQYTQAAAALERAKVNAQEKKVYLAAFVAPALPYEPSGPMRMLFSLLSVGAAALLYLGGRRLMRRLGIG